MAAVAQGGCSKSLVLAAATTSVYPGNSYNPGVLHVATTRSWAEYFHKGSNSVNPPVKFYQNPYRDGQYHFGHPKVDISLETRILL